MAGGMSSLSLPPRDPTTASPSPSPSPLSRSATPTLATNRDTPSRPTTAGGEPGWHFPGPSSKYHQRERTRPQHTRYKSTYTPQGPVLSTERRAHRRAQSYAGKGPTGAFGLPTPPGSECGRSPLGRFPFYTRSSQMAPSSITPTGPLTPYKSPSLHARRSSALQDSPFSDYFTDDARSVEDHKLPGSETQKLLVRLHKLQSQLMRGEHAPEMLRIVDRRVGEIEGEVEALHSQTRMMAEGDGEDLFSDDGEEMHKETRSQSSELHEDETATPLGIDFSPSRSQQQSQWSPQREDKLLVEAQAALKSLTRAQDELKKRHRELVELNEEHAMQMEEKETELLHLRSENEALKSDLGFDHSELLFLELQMKSLEVEANGEESKSGPSIKTERLQRIIENWRDDWKDVQGRFKRRRFRYGILEGSKRDSHVEPAEQNGVKESPADWKVDVRKTMGSRRVTSLTLSRVSSAQEAEVERPSSSPGLIDPVKAGISVLAPAPASIYASSATQTSSPPSPFLPPEAFTSPVVEKDFADLRLAQLATRSSRDDETDEEYDPRDDCAITTSPPSAVVADQDDPWSSKQGRGEQRKTALRELWSGLMDLAGVGAEDEE